MYDVLRVEVRQGGRQVARHPLRLGLREFPRGGDGIEQVATLLDGHQEIYKKAIWLRLGRPLYLDELEHQAQDAVGVDDVVQLDDVRVPQPAQHLHLALEHHFFALSETGDGSSWRPHLNTVGHPSYLTPLLVDQFQRIASLAPPAMRIRDESGHVAVPRKAIIEIIGYLSTPSRTTAKFPSPMMRPTSYRISTTIGTSTAT